ncbi:chemotaxis protein CheW [Ferruginivarius sediminum]|jgi:purine-binding chemotaxis protein CheW|uniref:Chemotaxis protein CheW n=1 Tax=Ferruginivarius sediminum TaxID=2661937 RepID=A0A369TGA5_9PROT|nr:chemotaxis protein CheW [Ferruginivarius sediminum]RDD63624.1 chemotaxis protein CheW [Ferruginivarius sediminum]
MTETANENFAHKAGRGGSSDYVTFTIADQLFGIPVLQVQDVLADGDITRIPLAPPEIAGALNLRGRIVTAVDVRLRLGLRSRADEGENMSIVVDHGGELYSLMVDDVGEVLSLHAKDFGRNPPTLDPKFREFSEGIYRLKDKLMVVLDVERLLDYDGAQAA